MNEQMKEKLSAFMDGELEDELLIRQLEQDDEARAIWLRYHVVRDVLHRDYMPGTHDIAAQVASALENEPTILAPKRWFTPRQVARQAAGVAIAATIATVAILVMREAPLPTDATPQSLASVGPITTKPVRLTADEERRLSGYLVSHTEYSASTRMRGMLPYTRIVSFTPAQGIAQRKVVNAQK